MPNKVWDVITYPFPNFNGATIEVWEWISNFIPHFIMDVITHLIWWKLNCITKRGLGNRIGWIQWHGCWWLGDAESHGISSILIVLNIPTSASEGLSTHWGQVTHICIAKLTIIGSDNGLSPGQHQAIISTNAGILLIGPLGTNFSEI